MRNLRDMRKPGGKGQRGTAAVEFALIAMVFFTLLLGIIEFGRLLYVWNTVQEVTRHAAREAVVSWNTTETELDAIKELALFGGASLPAGAEITTDNINIEYLNLSRGVIADASLPDDATANVQACIDKDPVSCIAFVRVSLQATYIPMIGLFTFLSIDLPASTVVMPAESLGYTP